MPSWRNDFGICEQRTNNHFYLQRFLLNVFIHRCLDFSGGLVELRLMLRYEWEIPSNHWRKPATKMSRNYHGITDSFADVHLISGKVFNTLGSKQNGRLFADIFTCISWMEKYEFQSTFHWSLFQRVKLIIIHYWFRQWLGADQATCHYLNQ